MKREGGFGREDSGRFAPEEKLSTEDLARTETEAAEPARRAEPPAPAMPMAPAPKESKAPAEQTPESAGGQEAADMRSEATPETPQETATSPREDEAAALLDSGTAVDLRSRWSDIQQGFVDDPQAAVRAADELVAEVMQLLATTFAAHKEGLESQWHQGHEVATEDLRIALRQYRSFFDRLLTT